MKKITTLCFVLFLMISIGTQAQKKTLDEAMTIAKFTPEERVKVRRIKNAENAEIKSIRSEAPDKKNITPEQKDKIKLVKSKSYQDIKATVKEDNFELYKKYWKKEKK